MFDPSQFELTPEENENLTGNKVAVKPEKPATLEPPIVEPRKTPEPTLDEIIGLYGGESSQLPPED
jgi:hypothetical protein